MEDKSRHAYEMGQLASDIKSIHDNVCEIKTRLSLIEQKMASVSVLEHRIMLLERIVYGLVALILMQTGYAIFKTIMTA